MIDVKKLMTGFLIIAVAAGASALLISSIGSGKAADVATNTAQVSGIGNGNAFLPQTNSAQTEDFFTADADNPALASAGDAIMNDPNNLTNILANNYINGLATTNPAGATMDANGNPTLTPPDTNSIISQFMGTSTTQSLIIPDWDIEANEIPITVVASSPAALKAYGTALGGILNENIIQTNMQGVLSNNTNADPSIEPRLIQEIQTALQDIAGLQTPSAAVNFQKDLIKTLVYSKNAIALGQNAASDPLKSELILEAEDPKYQAAVNDLQNQIQEARSQNLFSFEDNNSSAHRNKFIASIQSIIGIPTANAQWAVFDAVADSAIWATVSEMVKNEIKDIVLQLTKNTLVFIMQKTIFSAIKGSGAPAFIQQWGNTLANAFQTSALNALNAQMSCVGAAPFAPQLRLTLGATYKPNNNNVCAVQFQSQLGNNLNNFYRNFSGGGGWLTFGSTMKPSNNYYASLFFVAQTVGNTAQNAQNAAQSKSIAGQGFGGTATCTDGSNPNGQTLTCQGPDDVLTSTQAASCPAGTKLIETISNNGFCGNGKEPKVQTPGAIFDSMVGSAVDGNFKLITSATSWEGLASGLFVSILQQTLNSLAQTTIADVGGLLQQAANGGGANTVSSNGLNVTSGASTSQPITCYVTPTTNGNPFTFQLSANRGETISLNGISTPAYTWPTPPLGVTLSGTTGDTVIATFNATGTYQIVVNDTPDNTTGTCKVNVTGSSTN